MTKIKNTKKGMAKKTLSMSLVVAMLATSNVPVWAAEFSDGSETPVATEAPATEFSDNTIETPAIEEETTEAPMAQAVLNLMISVLMFQFLNLLNLLVLYLFLVQSKIKQQENL